MSEPIDIDKAGPEMVEAFHHDPLLYLLIKQRATAEQIIIAMAKRHQADTERAIEVATKCVCWVQPIIIEAEKKV